MLLQFAIGRFPPDDVVEFADDGDAIVRLIAAQRLANDRALHERAFSLALDLCADQKKAKRRELGAYLLGQLGVPEFPYKEKSIPLLERLAKDRSAAVKGAALVALGHLKAKSSKKLVLESLDDDDAGVVDAASYALWAIGRTEEDRRRLCAAVKRFDLKTRESIDLWND